MNPDGQPSETLRARAARGVALARASPSAALLISGGLGDSPPSEAEVGRRFAVEAGLAPARPRASRRLHAARRGATLEVRLLEGTPSRTLLGAMQNGNEPYGGVPNGTDVTLVTQEVADARAASNADRIVTFDPRHGVDFRPDHRAVAGLALHASRFSPTAAAIYRAFPPGAQRLSLVQASRAITDGRFDPDSAYDTRCAAEQVWSGRGACPSPDGGTRARWRGRSHGRAARRVGRHARFFRGTRWRS